MSHRSSGPREGADGVATSSSYVGLTLIGTIGRSADVARALFYGDPMFLGRRTKAKKSPEETAPAGRNEKMQISGMHQVLGTSMVEPFPENMERLIVGMGCFWGVEQLFWKLDGVYTTAAGYSGGITANPNYEETSSGLTGHAEAVLVVFDPEVIDLQQLLATFWENHDPTTPFRPTGFSSQYRSALYGTTAEQHRAAHASKEHYQSRLKERGYTKIHTEIAMAGEFYYAEEYHQQYMHKNPNALCANGFCQVSYN